MYSLESFMNGTLYIYDHYSFHNNPLVIMMSHKHHMLNASNSYNRHTHTQSAIGIGNMSCVQINECVYVLGVDGVLVWVSMERCDRSTHTHTHMNIQKWQHTSIQYSCIWGWVAIFVPFSYHMPSPYTWTQCCVNKISNYYIMLYTIVHHMRYHTRSSSYTLPTTPLSPLFLISIVGTYTLRSRLSIAI